MPKAELTPPPAADVPGLDGVVLYDHYDYQSRCRSRRPQRWISDDLAGHTYTR